MTDMFDTEEFARRLRVAVARLNIERQEAAKAIGIDPAVMSRMCAGRSRPSIETHARITAWLEKVERG